MRRAHFLRANKGCESPQQCVWFDTESDIHKVATDKIEHWLKFGWAAFRYRAPNGGWFSPTWFRFTTALEFWQWVEAHTHQKRKLYLFCHNTSFDFPILDGFTLLPSLGWKLVNAIIDAPPTVMVYKKNKASIVVVDTLNIWRMSLEKLGTHFGLAKLPMPKDEDPTEQWNEYCRRDVEVIMHACIEWWEFIRSNNFGNVQMTLASQAMSIYRHRYMRHDILIDAYDHVLKLARSALHGGRCEAFYIGKKEGEFYYLDVNSMYPYVMSYKQFPACFITYSARCNVYDLRKWLHEYCVVADVLVRIDEPVFPYYQTDKLIFPIGCFRTTLTTDELKYALQHGKIERVYSAAVYTRSSLFTDFVQDLYSMRMDAKRKGDAVTVWQIKILLNGFYGKWAQNGRKYKIIDHIQDLSIKTWVDIDAQTMTVRQFRQFGGIVQELITEGESSNSHPAIAAHITAYARMYLWELMNQAGREHIYYCDTDSLLTDRCGYEALAEAIAEEKLGGLKVEGFYNRIHIFGAKDYVFDTLVKRKGVRAKAIEIEPNVYQQERWTSLRGMIREGNLARPQTQTIRKRLKREYNKGIVTESGHVLPFELSTL